MLDNRSRAWKCLAQNQLIDPNSQFRKSWSKSLSYREIGTPTNVPPTPADSASLDLVWTRLHQKQLVTNVEVVRPWVLSHQSPVSFSSEAKKPKKPLTSEALGSYDISRLTRGTDAASLSSELRNELGQELPDPTDSTMNISVFHSKTIEAAIRVLDKVLGKKKPDPKYQRKWLSSEAKDMFERAELAAQEGEMSR